MNAGRPLPTAASPPTTPAPRPRDSLPRVLWQRFWDDRCPMMAAAISYQVLFAIIPMTALFAAGVGYAVRAPDVRAEVIRRIVERIPLDRNLVTDAIRALGDTSPPLTAVGIALLVWVAVGMFASVRDTLNVAWHVRGRGFVHQKLVDFASIVALGVLLLVSIVLTPALHTLVLLGRFSPGIDRLWAWLASGGPALASFAAFVLVYRYVPNVRHSIADVIPGAVLGALLFETAKHGFTWYVARFSRFEVLYGTLGAVMLFQLWVYVSALILLLGAEVNAVRSERGDVRG